MNKKIKLNPMQRILLNDYRHQQRRRLHKTQVCLEFATYCPRTKQWHDKAINRNEIIIPKTI